MTSGGTIKGLSPNPKAWIRDVGRPLQARRMLITMRLGVHLSGGRLADNSSSYLGRDGISRPYAGQLSNSLILLESKNCLTGGI